MKRLFAFLWLVIIGTNVAEYYSTAGAFFGAVVLAGTGYFLFVFITQLGRLVSSKDYFLFLSMLVVPVLLMLLSDRPFERSAYTSHILIALVFAIASVLAVRVDLDRTCAVAAFVIVAIGAALNLYELFVENNVWSSAPGRSAGLYVNPNISGEALVGYGLAFLTARSSKPMVVDLILTALVLVGVFATFSRAAILASVVLLPPAALLRAHRNQIPRVVNGLIALTLVTFAFGSYVLNNLNLSKDATIRISSLLESGGIGDYQHDRGMPARESLELAMENPLFGMGVRYTNEMKEGPHNMFVAMMVDYGILGLIAYLIAIMRLVLIARRGDRQMSGGLWLYVGWLIIFGFATHNLLGATATIPLLGLAMARAYQIEAAAECELIDDFNS